MGIDQSASEPADPADALRDGYIVDFISGLQVKATPEETEATQVFSRRLVEELGYSLECVQTRPQYTVRRRPSDRGQSYPVDIAVFSSAAKDEANLEMVVECKKKTRRDGRRQLELYLTMSHARIGAWFNGSEHLYMLKEYVAGGEIVFRELPTLPRHGQRVEDIGKYRRADLRRTDNLKALFKDIRNHLAGNLTGITRDETLAQQIINVLFCKIFDEMDKGPDEYVEFRAGAGEDPETVHERILGLFAQVKSRYRDVFSAVETIEIDPPNLAYVVGELQNYAVTEANRDAIGDAFEVFIGPALRGTEGQFFTPRNVVRMMIDVLDPQPGELVIDPACGSGGFLIVALEHAWQEVERQAQTKGWTPDRTAEERRYVASRFFKGIEKDRFLAKVTKAYMAVMGDGRAGVFCDNSLVPPASWDGALREEIRLGTFDVVVTNPPFGTKIPVKGREVLEQYTLGHKFVRTRQEDGGSVWEPTSRILESQAPQLLFIERCLQLLRPGGRLGIVLPESLFGMPTYTFVVQHLRRVCTVVGVVSMPEDLFQPHTHAKTCVVFIKNVPPPSEPYDIFMSVVEWCGHDSRGNDTVRRGPDGLDELLDDVPKVAPSFAELMPEVWAQP